MVAACRPLSHKPGGGGHRFQSDAATDLRRGRVFLGQGGGDPGPRRRSGWSKEMKGRLKRLAVALAGTCALAIPSTAANATLTITSPTTTGVSVSSPNQVNTIEWTFGFVDTNTNSPFSD